MPFYSYSTGSDLLVFNSQLSNLPTVSCYQCITHWYQECENNTCPMCRKEISFEPREDVREVHIQCNQYATIDDYVVFHDLLDR